jgi:hypothetical protein
MVSVPVEPPSRAVERGRHLAVFAVATTGGPGAGHAPPVFSDFGADRLAQSTRRLGRRDPHSVVAITAGAPRGCDPARSRS